MWYRVFLRSAVEVLPSHLIEHLHSEGFPLIPHFRGDDLGWTVGELIDHDQNTLTLSRFLTEVDDLRQDLNSFAAELETMTYNDNNVMLMERVIQTRQLITLRRPIDFADESSLDRLLTMVCRFLATQAEGVYQIDRQGWFAADGSLLLPEY